jgi:DNA replication and repair protein RecF
LRVEAEADGDRSGAVYADADRKRVTLGGKSVSRLSSYIGWLSVTVMSIDDIWIVRGSPARRRAFLDWAIAKLSSTYAADLTEYRKVVFQRNRFLQIYRDNGSEKLLESYDERLIESGNEIYKKREAKLPEIRMRFAEFGQQFSTKGFDVNYQSSCAKMRLDAGLLRRVRPREIALGQTLAGPHRDDLVFLINGRPMRSYASEGEERAASIALKLAEAEMLFAARGERPILLLDEVGAELDLGKREILQGLLKGQVFYASTQMPASSPGAGRRGRTFRIKDGAVEVS